MPSVQHIVNLQRFCKNHFKWGYYTCNEIEKCVNKKPCSLPPVCLFVVVFLPPNVDTRLCNPILFIQDVELYLIGRGLSGPGVAIKRPCFNFFHSFIHLRLYQVQKQKSRIVHANNTKNFVQIKSDKMFQWSNKSKHFRSCGTQPTWPSIIHVQRIKMSFP